MCSLADKGRTSEIGYFLGDSVLDDEPIVAAGHHCFLTAVGEGHDGNGGGRVDAVITEN